jgi:hypothetical protein
MSNDGKLVEKTILFLQIAPCNLQLFVLIFKRYLQAAQDESILTKKLDDREN